MREQNTTKAQEKNQKQDDNHPMSLKEIHRIMIRYLTFKIVLHSKHNNFYALVNPSQREQTENKGKKQRKRHKSHQSLAT